MSATLNICEHKAVGGEQRESISAAHCQTLAARSAAARKADWLMLLGLMAMFVVAALWRPPDEPQWVLCPFRALTHYPCPGCGMTRAFCALAHLEFWRAVKFNALSPLLFLAALVIWARAAANVFRLERLRSLLARLPRATPLASKVALALVMAWWVARLAGGF
jgi:hypothetical protein